MKKSLPILLLIGVTLLFSCKKNDLQTSSTPKSKQEKESWCQMRISTPEQDAASNAYFASGEGARWMKSAKMLSTQTTAPCILVDFDGQSVTDPYWVGTGGYLYCQPSILNSAEKDKFYAKISEVFQAYNPNVSIVRTPDTSLYFSAPPNRRSRLIVSPTKPSGVGESVGGVGRFNSFGLTGDNLCFSFDTNPDDDGNLRGLVGAHELGHNLGLYHQSNWQNVPPPFGTCTKVDEYRKGSPVNDPSAPAGWSPIMGLSGWKLCTFCQGYDAQSCRHIVNEYNAIATYIPLGSDEFGNTIATAQPISRNVNYDGRLQTTNDVDYFTFTALSSVTFTVTSYNCVDIVVDLYGTTGNFIMSIDVANNPNMPTQVINAPIGPVKYLAVHNVTTAQNNNAPSIALAGRYTLIVQ